MVRDVLKAFIMNGLPTVATTIGTMWAYDKRNSIKYGLLGGIAGWGAGYAVRSLLLRLVDNDGPALPAATAAALPPLLVPARKPAMTPTSPEDLAPQGGTDNVVNIGSTKGRTK